MSNGRESPHSAALTLLRHLGAVLMLPVTVTVLIPWWIAGEYDVRFLSPSGVLGILQVIVGLDLFLAGLALFLVCLFWFASRGSGTLAPWDPPRNLVVGGPYRFVRNPMISGVILILWGEALLLRSFPHAIWAAAFVAMNVVVIPLLEEPQLEARFREHYREYRKHVPRFLPRLRPWKGGQE